MKAMFGIVSLLVVLAIVGVLVKQQLRGTRSLAVSAPPGTASAPEAMGAATGNPPGSPPGTVRTQAEQLQQQVRSDVNRALEQGARRRSDAEQ